MPGFRPSEPRRAEGNLVNDLGEQGSRGEDGKWRLQRSGWQEQGESFQVQSSSVAAGQSRRVLVLGRNAFWENTFSRFTSKRKSLGLVLVTRLSRWRRCWCWWNICASITRRPRMAYDISIENQICNCQGTSRDARLMQL
ncbi:uncharacterized protein Dana_GF26304, isoform A [Drosophila ananassae]|uniref:Uncharacterized protein, isoform A n=1 Tax=Drosophila ananassae TaxID=7217 RepID=A0A0P8XHF0_DROAN|nr:uncharacterized protein Dana_GF26304, isoform A [Drosophila ananassae]